MTTPQPTIVTRDEQPYVAYRATVTMASIPAIADRIGDVVGWLMANDIPLAGAPFLKYNVIDMGRELEMEAGVPTQTPVDPAPEMISGVIPAGRYATVTHVGPPSQLVDATAALLTWADQQGLTWDRDGERWGCRLEIYQTDPTTQPDVTKWETDLAFKLA
ncbi:GyrI-like domain-containing protein [Fodinicola acaciae]|uniref:GyrI-like domain-containing protein n=1 Tax=Fodinicola acaciae TaxID=2681555 RepID=UPI0013CF4F81|nr:GyrI-like domain-containing protein [Fodinicola acaciae]